MPADLQVDITSAAFKANPFPFYKRLRAEAPVHQVVLPDKQSAFLVTRYDDVASVLRDERFVKNRWPVLSPEQLARQPWVPKMFKPLERNMLDVDPPDHTRLRGLVQKAFSPRLVDGMRGQMETMANELLDAGGRRNRMDLIHDYALPIPTTIIAQMLGVSLADRHKIHRWSSTLMTSSASPRGMLLAIPAAWRFMRYIRKLIQARKKTPCDDLVTALVQAHVAGDSMSDDELLSMVLLLIIAGHETTVNLIGNGTLVLLEHPDQLAALRADPTLIESAVEELLRFTNPVETGTERFAREDVTIAGVTIPRGSLVLAAIASANHDESQFPDPERLDITRSPNKHMAFGFGIHFCLGASLARLEAQIAINTLLARTEDLRLAIAPEAVVWRRGMVLRGLKALPVAFTCVPRNAVQAPAGVS